MLRTAFLYILAIVAYFLVYNFFLHVVSHIISRNYHRICSFGWAANNAVQILSDIEEVIPP